MLIKDVVQGYGPSVTFVNENYGKSAIMDKYGIDQYPAVFVGDALVARPTDFGWMGEPGKYAPWKLQANHEKFQRDVRRMLDVALRAPDSPQDAAGLDRLAALPQLTTVTGTRIDASTVGSRSVIVAFWSSWCVPCKPMIGTLQAFAKANRTSAVVFAPAIESDEGDVRNVAKSAKDVHVFTTTGGSFAPFGDPPSTPAVYVYGPDGTLTGAVYGLTNDLPQRLKALVEGGKI